MKKLLLLTISSILFISASQAQNINEGNFYFGARSTGLDFSFSDKTYVDVSVAGGYFIMDKLSIGGQVGIQSYDSNTGFRFMADVSYYFAEVGPGTFFGRFGMGADQELGGDTSFVIDITGGYSIFITDKIAIEPTAGFFIPFRSGRDAAFNLGAGFSLYF